MSGRETIYVQPLCAEGSSDAGVFFRALTEYLSAFFHTRSVKLSPVLTVPIDRQRRRGRLLGKEVRWRDHCPANDEALPQGQLDAGVALPVCGHSNATDTAPDSSPMRTYSWQLLSLDRLCLEHATTWPTR